MIHILSNEHSILNQYANELRNVNLQNDRMRFRKNLQRIGQLVGYEISKQMDYEKSTIETPLGTHDIELLKANPIIGGILRAGIPLYEGLLDTFDNADNFFIGSYRKHHKDGSFNISQEYITSPSLEGRDVIVADPMLATGASLVVAIKELLGFGTPKSLHIVTAISSQQGVETVTKAFPHAHLWTLAIDEELTAKGYIVPGLGDAGDLAFGPKSNS